MGTRTGPIIVMAWQRTLGEMSAAGTELKLSCSHCGAWAPVSLNDLFCYHGPDYILWDRRPDCDACGKPMTYLAACGAVFMPLISEEGRPTLGLPPGYRPDI